MRRHVTDTDHEYTDYICKGCNELFSLTDEKNVLPLNRCKQHLHSTGHRGYRKVKTCVSKNANANASKRGGDEDDDEEWECGECQKTFKTENSLRNHQLSTGHTDPTCPVCEKVFGSARALEQHLDATAHGILSTMNVAHGSIPIGTKNGLIYAPSRQCGFCLFLGETDPLYPDFLFCNVPECSNYFLRNLREHACQVCHNGYYVQNCSSAVFMCISCLSERRGNQSPPFPQLPVSCVRLMPLKHLNECTTRELRAYCDSRNLPFFSCTEKREIVSMVYRDRLQEISVGMLLRIASAKKLPIDLTTTDRAFVIGKILEVSQF